MEIPDTPIPPSSPRTVTFQPWQGSALRRINSTSVGNHVKRHEKSFDVRQLPKDLQRVHNTLKKKYFIAPSIQPQQDSAYSIGPRTQVPCPMSQFCLRDTRDTVTDTVPEPHAVPGC